MREENWAIIKAMGANVENILFWYLHRVQLTGGEHLRYQGAVGIVSQIKGEKTKG